MNRKVLIAAAIFITLVSNIIVFVLLRGKDEFVGEKVENENSYILRFEQMNETDSHVFMLHENDALSVEHSIEHGRVDVLITMDNKEPIYKGNDIQKGKFEVVIPEDGEYIVTVKAENGKGDLSVQVLNKDNKE